MATWPSCAPRTASPSSCSRRAAALAAPSIAAAVGAAFSLELEPDEIVGSLGPMGPTRMQLSKPVIAAVEGHAVAGGLGLACWADLRVAARDATFGVYCRRWGVPLVDGGTVRLPRLIGQTGGLNLPELLCQWSIPCYLWP